MRSAIWPPGDPDGMAGHGTEGRQRIADVFRTGPVLKHKDTAPDPRFVDDVLGHCCKKCGARCSC